MIPKTPKSLIDVLKHLHKLEDDFPYSQLALCLDTKNLFDLMRVFGGQKLYIPTTDEFIQLCQFCLVEEIGDYKTAVAINPGVLRGFTERRYIKFSNRVHNRTQETKDEEGDSTGENE